MSPEETRLREALVWAWTGVNVGVVMVSTDDLTALLSEVERLGARAERLARALRSCRDQLWLLAKDPSSNPWVVEAEAALAQEGEG